MDVSATEAILGYRLRQYHVGVVCWAGDAAATVDNITRLEHAIGHVAGKAGPCTRFHPARRSRFRGLSGTGKSIRTSTYSPPTPKALYGAHSRTAISSPTALPSWCFWIAWRPRRRREKTQDQPRILRVLRADECRKGGTRAHATGSFAHADLWRPATSNGARSPVPALVLGNVPVVWLSAWLRRDAGFTPYSPDCEACCQ
jgi:hypothetical protein